MAQKDPTKGAEADTQRTDYAFWDLPAVAAGDGSVRVIYSLQLFHEIDFVVNEGYRKIPHGGIETAGLLFGSIGENEIRIEAFRPIECEHASGPSISFSERDLHALEMQIQQAGSEPDLAGLQPIGWFLGHTRAPLELTEAEATHFDKFFPGKSKLTLLVKPERFQPTRFGFLIRRAGRELPRDGTALAVILPLPGRSFKPGQLIPSIPAPNPIAAANRASQAAAKESAVVTPDADSMPAAEARPVEDMQSLWKAPVDAAAELANEAAPVQPSGQGRRKLARERARVMGEAPVPPSPPAPVSNSWDRSAPTEGAGGAGGQWKPSAPAAPFRPAAMPSLPIDAARFVPSAYDRQAAHASDYSEYQEDAASSHSVLNARSVTALAFAALLGCIVGYVAYLQLPAPVIAIDVRPLDQTIVVSWPPEETRTAVYAAIRLNDGPPVPLSALEKKNGHVALSAAKDFKVEIVARNWVRDSRGIVRYLHSNSGSGQGAPNDAPRGRLKE